MEQNKEQSAVMVLQIGGTGTTALAGLLHSKGLTLSTTNEIISAICLCEPEKSLVAAVKSLDDIAIARAGGGTQVSKLRKELGDKNIRLLLATLIYDLSGYYNVVRNLTDGQVQMLVEEIITDFWYLKIEQVARAFYLQKRNSVVRILDRIDPGTVVEILTKYTSGTDYVYERDALQFKEDYDPNRVSKQTPEKEKEMAFMQYKTQFVKQGETDKPE